MESLLAHCSASFSNHGNLFVVFLLGGLAGSLTHCLAMCGPAVACQAACGSCCSPMGAASQWQYHAGRLLTYGLLGFAASYTASFFSGSGFWSHVSAVMMMTAGLLFLVSGIFPARHWPAPSANAFLRGVLMSFMPCGLLYAALMLAATIPNPLSGMIAMWCFVLGTMPVLLASSASAALLAQKQQAVRSIGRIGLTFNGLALLAMALR